MTYQIHQTKDTINVRFAPRFGKTMKGKMDQPSTQALSPTTPVVKPCPVQRSTSLPSKLELAPPSRPLFWFLPNNGRPEAAENRSPNFNMYGRQQARPQHEDSAKPPMTPQQAVLLTTVFDVDDESSTAYSLDDGSVDELLGLQFLDG